MPILNVVDRIAGKFCRIASMLVLPQSPQLLEIVPSRCTELSLNLVPAVKATMTTFSRDDKLSILSRVRTIPSESKNPAASSCAEDSLLRILKNYDRHRPGIYFVEELPKHSLFKVKSGRIFTKGNKIRKRFLCTENSTGKLFLFSPVAEVELVQ